MANENRADWPRNRDTRITLFSGRSRSVGSFRAAHMEPGTNRLREPRLSIGAGIRDLERRTAEVPNILRNNINNVIEELRPIVERARTNTDTIMSGNNNANVTLASLLGASHQPAITTSRDTPNAAATVNSEEVVIDMDGTSTSVTVVAQNGTSPNNNPPSPTQSVDTVNTNNNNSANSNNGSGDEQDIAETQVLNVSNSAVLNTICKYLPFVILIFTKFVFDHIPGILMFIGLTLTFYYYNTLVKKEVGRQISRSFPMFCFLICHIMVAIGALFFVIYNENVLHLCLGIMPQTGFLTLSELLWSVIVTDYILKMVTIIIKIVFTLLPQWLIPTSKRGKWYLFIEATSQLYRNAFPIQPWLHYLLDSYSGPQKVIGVFLSAAYMVSKGNLLMNAIKLWWMSLLKVLRNVTIGVTPTKEQIASAGNLCSICHDEFKTPVLLECQHIFCEVCVCKWLDREQTCPLCRAKIADDPSWRDGSTTYFIQLF